VGPLDRCWQVLVPKTANNPTPAGQMCGTTDPRAGGRGLRPFPRLRVSLYRQREPSTGLLPGPREARAGAYRDVSHEPVTKWPRDTEWTKICALDKPENGNA